MDAAAFYCKYLGSEILGIPFGREERLKIWPALKPKNFRMYTTGKDTSCADVVLSSAGMFCSLDLCRNQFLMNG